MATFASIYGPKVPGSEKFTCTDVTMSASYTTGGEAVAAANLGLSSVLYAVAVVRVPGGTASCNATYDLTNSKVIIYNTTAQVGNGVDLSACIVRVLAFGS